MKKGALIGVRQSFGTIELVRFHSTEKSDRISEWVNVYLKLDMATEHVCSIQVSEIVPNAELVELLKEVSKDD